MFHKLLPVLPWVTLAFFTLVAASPKYSWAQANPAELSSNKEGSDSPALKRDDAKDLAMFDQASKSIEQGRTEIGVEILRQLIQLRNDFGNMSELTFQISHKLALAYFKQGDYPSVIYLANAIGRSRPTSDLWCGLRAAAYKKLQLPSTEFDELRSAVRMYPEDITNRKELAFELAQTEVPTLRNGLEALLAVEYLEQEFANDPLIAKCIAAAAAEAGDFPLAIRLQSQYIQQVNSVPQDVAIYQPLLYKLITEVDGIPTPTLSEWLVASERAWSRGVDTIALTVYDDKLAAFSIVYVPTTKAAALQPAAPRVDSEAAVAEAYKWIEANVHPDIYAKTGITLSRRIKRAIADNRNISMFFDGYAMANDLPAALLVRDGELVTQTLNLRATELSGPGRGNISINPFGRPSLRSDESLKIVKLHADPSRSTQHGEIILNLEISGLMAAQGKFAVRVQFISPAKVPILIPLQDVPAPNTTDAIALTVALVEESVSQNLGDVAVVDIVEVFGDLKSEQYSSVSNQWLGYIELADADTIQQILEIERNSDQSGADDGK